LQTFVNEHSLIEGFVIKERQQRYFNLLQTQKGRKKLRSYISHFRDLNAKYIQNVSHLQTSSELYLLLKSIKAPDNCYIISENTNYDAKTFPLQLAIDQLCSSGISYFLCCIQGKLNYYEGEDFNSKYLLIKS